MPGIDRPDIAVDTALSGPLSLSDVQQALALPWRSLVTFRLGLVGLDSALAALVVTLGLFLCPPLPELRAWLVTCFTLFLDLCFLLQGLYAAPQVRSQAVNCKKIALAWLQAIAAGFLIFCLLTSVGESVARLPFAIVRSLHGLWVPALLVAGTAASFSGRLVFARAYSDPAPLHRTVVIGEFDPMQDLLGLIDHGVHGPDIVGIFHEPREGPSGAPRSISHRGSAGLQLLGGLDALERMVRRNEADSVIVALSWSSERQAGAIIKRLSMIPVDVYLYYPIMASAPRAEPVHELPLVKICARQMTGQRPPSRGREVSGDLLAPLQCGGTPTDVPGDERDSPVVAPLLGCARRN